MTTYLGKGGQIPYLSKSKIIAEVESVMGNYWGGRFPVDVEEICDGLNIGIVPVPNLSRGFHIDAYISAGFSTICVDEDELGKESSRYRFSVAHELGHYILHRRYYPDSIYDVGEWLEVSRTIANNYAEFQANFFAANLLVPSAELAEMMNERCNGDFAHNIWLASSSELGEILNDVRKKFKVSDDVIIRRIREVFPGIEDR